MEYIGLFASYMITPIITTRVIFKTTNEPIVDLVGIMKHSGVIIAGIVVFTLVFSMIRAARVCQKDEKDPNSKKSLGIASGFVSSIWACVFAVGVFVLFNFVSIVPKIIMTIIPILKNYFHFVEGFIVALSAIIGYWFGRIFTSLC